MINTNFISKIILFFSIYSVTQSTFTPPVITENGAVIGTTDTVNGHSFKGIPFASPPIGDLRFKPSEPASNWNGNYMATYYRPACLQPSLAVPSLSEDCLYLNIWTPTLDTNANLSVMVWIYGGGFLVGSASQGFQAYNFYDGTYLALRDVVVVSFNYRLNIFGFLYGNSSEAPGNAGLWDQVMAINWTRRNIANFGGNPNDITLFGESAGSMAITDLIVTNPVYGVRDWFNKAILLSGGGYLIKKPESAYKLARDYVRDAYQCIDDQTWIDCLRYTPASVIFANQSAYQALLFTFVFTPIYGDSLGLVPYHPNIAAKQGYFRQDLKILMNHNEMEGEIFAMICDIVFGLGGRYSSFVPLAPIINKFLVRNDVLNNIFVNCPFKQNVRNAFVEPFTPLDIALNQQPIRRSVTYALGDYFLSCPEVLFGSYITQWKSFTGKVFQSRFTYQDTLSPFKSVWSNSTHGEDLPSIFGLPLYAPGFTSDDRFISIKMIDLITYFAKTGDVLLLNPTVYSEWPKYSVNNGRVNASYVELHPNSNRLGRVFVNQYRGNDRYYPRDIYNCFGFWEQYLLNYEMCFP